MAEKIVPNINRLAQAVRMTGGTVIWIKTTFKDDALKNWSTYFEMVKPEQGARRVAALTAGSKGHELWAALDVRADDLIVEKIASAPSSRGRQILPKSCASVAWIPFSSRARSPTCAASRRRATP